MFLFVIIMYQLLPSARYFEKKNQLHSASDALHLELVSEELNHLAAILHVYAGIFMK